MREARSVAALGLAYSDLGSIFNALRAAGAVALPTRAIRSAMRLDARIAREPFTSRLLRGPLGRWLFKVGGTRLAQAARAVEAFRNAVAAVDRQLSAAAEVDELLAPRAPTRS